MIEQLPGGAICPDHLRPPPTPLSAGLESINPDVQHLPPAQVSSLSQRQIFQLSSRTNVRRNPALHLPDFRIPLPVPPGGGSAHLTRLQSRPLRSTVDRCLVFQLQPFAQ